MIRSGGALILVFCVAVIFTLVVIWGGQVYEYFARGAQPYTVIKEKP